MGNFAKNLNLGKCVLPPWGAWCKKGALKIVYPLKGALENITTNFSAKIDFTWYSVGLTHVFHGKRGVWNFWRFEGGHRNIFIVTFFICIRPPNKWL